MALAKEKTFRQMQRGISSIMITEKVKPQQQTLVRIDSKEQLDQITNVMRMREEMASLERSKHASSHMGFFYGDKDARSLRSRMQFEEQWKSNEKLLLQKRTIATHRKDFNPSDMRTLASLKPVNPVPKEGSASPRSPVYTTID